MGKESQRYVQLHERNISDDNLRGTIRSGSLAKFFHTIQLSCNSMVYSSTSYLVYISLEPMYICAHGETGTPVCPINNKSDNSGRHFKATFAQCNIDPNGIQVKDTSGILNQGYIHSFIVQERADSLTNETTQQSIIFQAFRQYLQCTNVIYN